MNKSSGANSKFVRSSYLWNTTGSMLNAFQSVIMLMVLTRVCDLVTAGVFTLAYANANLFLNLGGFGMRNFEASDVEPRYSFGAYGRSRVVTGIAMVVCSWGWLAYSAWSNDYSWDKTAAVALMTLMKGVDAVEDVFDGGFQQSGRLDIAGKLMTIRVGTTIAVFCVSVIVTANLAVATAVGFVWTVLLLVVGLVLIQRKNGLPLAHPEAPEHSALRLLRECSPLFLSAFLLFYVGNAPKYAIDAMMDDSVQAIYGFIAMPVFVVGLLAQFVYMPLVQPLSEDWAQMRVREFLRVFAQQIVLICGIALVCVVGAALVGPPVLGILYNTDLYPYRLQLCLLVLGGGLLALASLFTMGITIMRRQALLTPGYVGVATLALLSSGPLVSMWGMDGAVCCYLGCMALLAACFGVMFFGLALRVERQR